MGEMQSRVGAEWSEREADYLDTSFQKFLMRKSIQHDRTKAEILRKLLYIYAGEGGK